VAVYKQSSYELASWEISLKGKLTGKILNLFEDEHAVAVCFSETRLIITDIVGPYSHQSSGTCLAKHTYCGFLLSSCLVVFSYDISFSAVLKEQLAYSSLFWSIKEIKNRLKKGLHAMEP